MKQLITSILCAVMCLSLVITAWASPMTGDESNLPLWIGMMVAAVVLVIIILVMMSRGNRKRR